MGQRHETDLELVAIVIAGDRDSFAELVRRYEVKVRAYCSSMLSDREEGWDAAQEVFFKAFNNLSSFRQEAKFSTWLYRIAQNHCIDLSRSWSFRRFIGFEGLKGSDKLKFESEQQFCSKTSSALEARETISKVLEGLTAKERSLLLLRELGGLSYQEISLATGSSEDSVKSKLRRTRKKARAIRDRIEQ